MKMLLTVKMQNINLLKHTTDVSASKNT